MARVVLLSATPRDDQTDYNLAPVTALRKAAQADRFRSHSLTDNPDEAELILFAEFYGGGFHFERIRAHPFVQRYREKCFVFCSNAIVIPFLPGLYASVEQRWTSRRTRGGFYLGTPENEFATFEKPEKDLPYLFSFMGSFNNAPVRRRLGELSHPRAFLQDTAAEYDRLLHHQVSPSERREYYRRYAALTKATKFVLCPRGMGAATIRLFETMRMGRVPVIISDGWVPPEGPRWEEFSLRVREREVSGIPRFLEEREDQAATMGQQARAAWEEWFGPDVVFHRVVESCLAIKKQRRLPEALGRLPVFLQYTRAFHFRRLLRRKYEKFRPRDHAGGIAQPHLTGHEI